MNNLKNNNYRRNKNCLHIPTIIEGKNTWDRMAKWVGILSHKQEIAKERIHETKKNYAKTS